MKLIRLIACAALFFCLITASAFATNIAPVAGTISPSYGSNQPNVPVNLTATYTDANGWQNISAAYILVNTAINGRNCFFAHYNQNNNRFYLRNDADTAWLGGLTPGSASIIENSYCKINLAQTTVLGSGNTLTIRWNITFKSVFSAALTKNIYLMVSDDAGASVWWVQKGTRLIRTNSSPWVGSISPSNGSSLANTPIIFTTTYADANGWQDISYVKFSLGPNAGWSAASPIVCYYDQNNNKLFLINDNGNGWVLPSGTTPGTGVTVSNSFVTLDCAKTTISGSANTLTVKWNLTFRDAAKSTLVKKACLLVSDDSNAYQGWVEKGTWLVGTNIAPQVGIVTPNSGYSVVRDETIITATYTDPNGAQDLKTCQLVINTSPSYTNCIFVSYDQNSNKFYLGDESGNLIGGFEPGTCHNLSNPYGEFRCGFSTVSKSGNTLTIKWDFVFYPKFSLPGNKKIYLFAKDDSNASSLITQKATWQVGPERVLSAADRSLLAGLLDTHLNYFLSSDAISSSGLPLGGYKEKDRGRYNYSNPAEWGYSMLAWLVAGENNKISKADAVKKMEKALNSIDKLQNDSDQNYHNLFYPYYYVTDRAGRNLDDPYHDANTNIPSIDNGLLYTSLWITEGWARINNFQSIVDKAGRIKNKMNFRMFLLPDKSFIAHLIDARNGNLGQYKWDIFADEGGVMSWIAYLSNSVTLDEYKNLVDKQWRWGADWANIHINEAQWFNAMFAWGVRSWVGIPVGGWEDNTDRPYGLFSFAQAVKGHLAYGDLLGIDYPAFSDAMTQPGMAGRYTPPNIPNQIPLDIPRHIVPHALFVPLCVYPDLEPDVLSRLLSKIRLLSTDTSKYYHYGQDSHKPFGFEVTASPYRNHSYSGVESRYVYETLSAAFTVLSLSQALNIYDGTPTLFYYANQLPGYQRKIDESLLYLYGYTPGEGPCGPSTGGV